MRSTADLGVRAGLAAAVLFGASTPLAKQLLNGVGPWALAGLLYSGAGVGLFIVRRVRRAPAVRLRRAELLPLAGAVFSGGMLAPLLLLVGLQHLPASGTSLLLNAEGVFTALLAWFVFKENVDRRIALGMASIVAGAIVLTVSSRPGLESVWPSLAVLGACACWGLDNNLTRKLALNDATWLAMVKGGIAGPVNLGIALVVGTSFPAPASIAAAAALGFLSYGVSLGLFIVSMRHVGTARAGAYFSVAPFFGGVLALAMGESLTPPLVIAGALMASGVWLHLSERHEHPHTHEPLEHEHWHVHDEHHHHEHDLPVATGVRHSHPHVHEPLRHSHPHFPDSHHRHSH